MRRPSPRGEDTRPTVSGTAPPHQPSHRTPDAGRPARPSAPVHHVGDSATTPVTPRRSRRCSSRHSTNRPKGRNCRTRYGSRRPRRRCRLGSVHATERAQQPGRRILGLRHHVLPVTVGASQGETVGERGKRLHVPPGQRQRAAQLRGFVGRDPPHADQPGLPNQTRGDRTEMRQQRQHGLPGPEATRPRGGRIPQSRTTSTGVPRAPVAAALSAGTCAVHSPPDQDDVVHRGPVEPQHGGPPLDVEPADDTVVPDGQGARALRPAGTGAPSEPFRAPGPGVAPGVGPSSRASERQGGEHPGQLLAAQPGEPGTPVASGVLQRAPRRRQFVGAAPGHPRRTAERDLVARPHVSVRRKRWWRAPVSR